RAFLRRVAPVRAPEGGRMLTAVASEQRARVRFGAEVPAGGSGFCDRAGEEASACATIAAAPAAAAAADAQVGQAAGDRVRARLPSVQVDVALVGDLWSDQVHAA